jgi:antitoxin component YwqK of YwqJK toxin-antitoxin module/Tfp pilus assembly protein PilF
MKRLLTILLLLLAAATRQTVAGQDNKPFIPSGILLDSGVALYDSGIYRQAIDVLGQINRNDTNYVKALYNIGLCYYDDSQYVKSLYYNQLALSLHSDPEQEPLLLNQYGNSVDAAGETLRAMGIFDSAIRLYPGYSLLYMNKGTMLFKLKRYAEAEAVFQQTLLMDPYSYGSHFKLGMCALNQGKLIPAMLCFLGYLLVDPDGGFHNNCVNMLKSIANNSDFIQDFLNNRKEQPSEAYQLLEQIVQSKIALDDKYKLTIQPDDPILRQIQVVFEKMQYDPADSDFYLQYYIPHFKACFDRQQFQFFINQAFSGLDIPVLEANRKRNKKEMSAFIDTIVTYFNQIRETRELKFTRRDTVSRIWTYSHGKLDGHGFYRKKDDKFIGPWEFYYSKGNIRARGLYNDHGDRDGPWTYYFFDGAIRSRVQFAGGLQTDICTWYFPDGTMSSRTRYQGDLADGESISYYLVGTPNATTHYKADKEDGVKVGFFSNGDTSYTEYYSAGELNGQVKTWYQSGKLESEYTFENGKVAALYTKYYENGRIEMQGNYNKGDQVGVWKTYYSNGQLKTEQNLANGKLEGDEKDYNENGTVSYTSTSRHGKLEGETHYYDDDGKQYALYQYEKGLLQRTSYFDKGGKPSGGSTRTGGRIDVTQYYPDGSRKADIRYDADDNLTGKETFYFPSGKVQEEDNYLYGSQNGVTLAWYPDGAPKSEIDYARGKMNGLYRTHYANGKTREQGWQMDGDPCGLWVAYNDLGAITDSVYYSDGVVNGYQETYQPNGKRSQETLYKRGWIWELTQFDTTGRVSAHLHFPAGTGKLLTTYADGRPHVEGQYTRGKLDGPYHIYFYDGKKLEEETYVRGQLDGEYRGYSHSGVLNTEGRYHYGNKNGTWKYYFPDGKLKFTEEYAEGKLNGKNTRYFENGRVEYEITYQDDVQTGPFTRYDPDGTLLYEVMLKNNIPVTYTYLDKSGKRLPPIPIVAQALKMKTFFPNGNTSAEMEYKDGLLTGTVKIYYTNGRLKASYNEKNGTSDGAYTLYYSNGQTEAEYFYVNGNLHGDYTEYNEKGSVTESGTYYDGSPHGLIRYYDDQGKLKQTEVYHYGTLLSVK